MLVSNLLTATLRTASADAEVISHQLMLRAGMVRQVASGIYVWLPLGLKVLRKVENIVREEMDHCGAQEVLMPGVQPADLWRETGRWDQFGVELLRLQDRHQRDFCLGPTHEEVITDLVRREVRSYKQLPCNFYQIQTKFRDERRPRFGVMRAREFIMKDAYSFHLSQDCLEKTYASMYSAYERIFTRLGLHFRAVLADSGNIGGAVSHEFHVLADAGEDEIVYTENGSYAANIELAPSPPQEGIRPSPQQELNIVDTPGQHSIAEVAAFLQVPVMQIVKTLIVHGAEGGLVALLLRGDDELNAVKASKLSLVAAPLKMAEETEIRQQTGCGIGSLGPKDLGMPIIADHRVSLLADFVAGANQEDKHFTGLNWQRDLPVVEFADLRKVQPGEAAVTDGTPLCSARGIEVGHIFQLGEKYSTRMRANCLNESGKSVALLMGCYGIGITRIVAAAIEQNHDEAGIIWPSAMAPFQVILLPINMHRSLRLRAAVMDLYEQLRTVGIEVLLDDRHARPGVMFAEAELIGIPYHIIMSDTGLDKGTVEYKSRREKETRHISQTGIIPFLQKLLRAA